MSLPINPTLASVFHELNHANIYPHEWQSVVEHFFCAATDSDDDEISDEDEVQVALSDGSSAVISDDSDTDEAHMVEETNTALDENGQLPSDISNQVGLNKNENDGDLYWRYYWQVPWKVCSFGKGFMESNKMNMICNSSMCRTFLYLKYIHQTV